MLCRLFLLLAAAAGATKPNVVFFLADDYGFADVSYHTKMYGNTSNVIDTPNLDALAASGVRLENYYVQAVCSPTRANLLTGRYSIHNGIHVPLVDSAPGALPLDEVLIAEKMKEAGYVTHMVGKWHLGFKAWEYTPTYRGFDTFYGYFAGSQDYWNKQSLCWAGQFENGCFENTTKTGEAVTGLDFHRGKDVVRNNTEYSTKAYTDEAVRLIEEHASSDDARPFFLYLPHQAVHVGNSPTASHPEYALDQAPQRYIDEYAWVADEERRNLSAMVTVMDESAGNVTAALKRTGMWSNTLFIFSTDNGGPTGKKASNYPLRGGKGTLWEGGVRGIGFVAAGDDVGLTMRGYANHQLIHVSDWFPTVCELCGCKLNGTKPLDGVSAWKAISTNSSSLRTEVVHDIDINPPWSNATSIRIGQYKLIVDQTGGAPNEACRTMGAPCLFDIYADPREKNDLAAKLPEVVKKIEARIEELRKTAIPHQDRFEPDPRSNPNLHGGVWLPWL